MQITKIGHGFDIHPLVPGRKCIIGGVNIPFELGLDGHSDADVLLHALCDSLIGAMGLGDIGHFFPDSDDSFKDINSRLLLSRVYDEMIKRNFVVNNIDATIICEKPKIAPYSEQMKQNIAKDLKCDLHQINVKAKTMEKIGSIGRCEGIAAEVVCLINSSQVK